MEISKTFHFQEHDVLISENINVRDIKTPVGCFLEDNRVEEDCFI